MLTSSGVTWNLGAPGQKCNDSPPRAPSPFHSLFTSLPLCNFVPGTGTRGPFTRGPPGLCPLCPPHCYATVNKTWASLPITHSKWLTSKNSQMRNIDLYERKQTKMGSFGQPSVCCMSVSFVDLPTFIAALWTLNKPEFGGEKMQQ